MLTSILAITALALGSGALLGFAAVRFRVEGNPIADQVDAVLPQTQCGQCGFGGCRPYAEAIAAGEAEINRCPPGGQDTVQTLADLLGVEPLPLDEERGETPDTPRVAWVDESVCIGCTRCIQACPVDAILGAPKQMHTVIRDECTGCDLCVDPCPVDCIHMVPVELDLAEWHWPLPADGPRSSREAA